MSGPFIVISRSRIKPGQAERYAQWSAALFRDVEAQEPRLLAFNQWHSADHSSSVVIQVHPDAESFEYHLKLFGGGRMQEMFELIDVDGVELFGEPNAFVKEFVTHGVPDLPVTLHPLHMLGFTRLQPDLG